MSKITEFKGFRPDKEIAEKVVSAPYDVLSSKEAKEIADKNDRSFLHVVKPEIDLPENKDLYSAEVYEKGAENLQTLIRDKVLIQDEKPSFYIYSQRMGEHFQTGLVALASAKEYIKDKIKKHEHTKPDKVKDRTAHIKAQGAHSGPVFLTYKSGDKINSIITKLQKEAPDMDVVGPGGVKHTLWVVDNPREIKAIKDEFSKINALYIADGHHRCKSAVENYRENKSPLTEAFLAVIFPHEQLKIMEYNRVVKDLNGLTKEEFLKEVSENYLIDEAGGPSPEQKHSAGMYLDKQWYGLTMKQDTIDENDPVNRLDAAILEKTLLCPVLGVCDPRKDKRIDFIGGIRGTKELEKLVNSGKWKVAFAMYPVSINDIMAVSDAGKVMPAKSTWFEPKLLSGMVVNIFNLPG
ncbi:MAG: DUF1015 family protein [Elusimicrobiota bacterium]|nr:DUF1015 family protein [Elusimicrobiota bacterium]